MGMIEAEMHQVSESPCTPARLSMVVLGDSLACGLGASQPGAGIAHRIFDRLREARPASSYANYAVPHSTMGDVLRHQVPLLRAAQADVVLLIAGANDLRYVRDRFVFGRRFRHLLDAVHHAAPRAAVIAAGMPDVTQTIGVAAILRPAIVRVCARLNRAMQRITEDFGDGFIDLFTYTNAPLQPDERYLCEDGYHPNDFGYAEIAERAYPHVEKKLRAFFGEQPST